MTNEKMYHYTECGLDNVYLTNGFTISGKNVSIKNIEGLNNAIGLSLVNEKKDLNGKEFRFLRHELLMSQNTLGRLLGVGVQSINRWENRKTEIPKSAENLLRLLYIEQTISFII